MRHATARGLILLGLALQAILAMQTWQAAPFEGYLLERHRIVSALHDPAWPAFRAGLRSGDVVLGRSRLADGRVAVAVRTRAATREVTFAPAAFPAYARWRFLLPWLMLGLLLGSLGIAIVRVRPDHVGALALADFTWVVAIFALTNLESVTTQQTWLINQLALGATPALAFTLARTLTARQPAEQQASGRTARGLTLAGMLLAAAGGASEASASIIYPAIISAACVGLLAIPIMSLHRALDRRSTRHARRRAATWAAGTGLALLPLLGNGAGGFIGGGMPAGILATMLLFPVTLGVLLARDQLFDIDLRGRRVIAYVLATAALTSLHALAVSLVATPVRNGGHAWATGAGGLAVAVGIAPLARLLRSLLDRFFDQVPYDPPETLSRFHAEARRCPDPGSLDRLRAHVLNTTVAPIEIPPARAAAIRSAGGLPPRVSGQPWGPRDLRFLQELDNAHALWHEHLALVAAHVREERVARELTLARQLQRAWLGRPPPPDQALDLAIRCLPALEVGGDFAEVHRRADGRWLIALGDVSGKGVPAALLMAATLALLRARLEGDEGPAEMLRELGSLLHRQRPSPAMFVTLSLALFDSTSGELRTASAGQREPWIGAMPPGASGAALGWFADERPPEHRHMLQPGTRVLWATDGLEDGLGHLGCPAPDRVGKVWTRLTDATSEDLAERLVAATRGAQGPTPPDDLTLVVLRWRPVSALPPA
ncbi:MAG: SpoIIE family protein phosphatase [Candidatus Sericytochromatia bacterium]|nr:SpoIIE family protein phosphatase [Candidatus Sericytochromatia bacterium]